MFAVERNTLLKKPAWAIIFCLLTAGGFLGVAQLIAMLPFVATQWGVVLAEMLLAVFAAVILLAIEKENVFTHWGAGFGEGLGAAGFMVVYLVLLTFGALQRWEQEPVGTMEIARFVAYMFAIGLAEELTFRGVIQNVLADAFGRHSEKGVWLTVALSGLIFGAAHLTNVFAGADAYGVMMQAMAAASIGMYMGAIYVRCGNIWFLVLLHGFNDLAGMLAAGGMEEQTMVESVSSYGPERLIAVMLYLWLTVFLLRRKKMEQIIRS